MKKEISDTKKVIDEEIKEQAVSTLVDDDIRKDVSKEEIIKTKEVKIKKISATSAYRLGFIMGQLTMLLLFLIYFTLKQLL